MVKRKQILGILGACLAVGGGITWYVHQYQIISVVLWGIAGIILFKLNKSKTRSKSRRR